MADCYKVMCIIRVRNRKHISSRHWPWREIATPSLRIENFWTFNLLWCNLLNRDKGDKIIIQGKNSQEIGWRRKPNKAKAGKRWTKMPTSGSEIQAKIEVWKFIIKSIHSDAQGSKKHVCSIIHKQTSKTRNFIAGWFPPLKRRRERVNRYRSQ